MGQKVNPIGFRIPLNRNWRSRWFADKRTFGTLLAEDDMIRAYVKKTFAEAAVSDIGIERYANRVRGIISTARPGVALGKRHDKASAATAAPADGAAPKNEPNLIDNAGLELRRKTGR